MSSDSGNAGELVALALKRAGVSHLFTLNGGHGSRQGAVADARPANVTRALDRGLALRAFGFGHGTGAAVDDQRRTCGR